MRAGRPWAVIAGGGTAGHVGPALAVAEALVARGHDRDDLLFVGSQRGLEARLVPEAGFPVVLLPGRGVVRRLSAANLVAIAGLGVAVVRAVWLLARRRPRVVLSVGGYASVPCALAAIVLRIPLVVAESNAVAGAANRLVGRWASASAVAFAACGLPREHVTGSPVRPAVAVADASADGRRAARELLGLPADRRILVVTGGSLGARRLNEATAELVTDWSSRRDVGVYHVVGSRDWSATPAISGDESGIFYRAVEYENRMHLVLVAADLVLSRAGGSTLAELTVLGRPSILVPLPIAPDDHQGVGARRLAAAGAAVVVDDAELTGARLEREVDALFSEPAVLASMAAAAASHGRPDATDRVADLVERYARA